MVIMESGRVGAVAARHAVEAGRSVSEPVTIQCLQMAGKIAMSRGWGPAKNALVVLSALARVSQFSADQYIANGKWTLLIRRSLPHPNQEILQPHSQDL